MTPTGPPLHNTAECPHQPGIQTAIISLQTKIDHLSEAVIGNESSAGAFERLRDVEKEHKIMWRKLDDVTKSIVGNGVAGLNERVRVLEQVRRKQEVFTWLLLGGVVGQGLIILRTLILGGM